jgi:hypothetical protein
MFQVIPAAQDTDVLPFNPDSISPRNRGMQEKWKNNHKDCEEQNVGCFSFQGRHLCREISGWCGAVKTGGLYSDTLDVGWLVGYRCFDFQVLHTHLPVIVF